MLSSIVLLSVLAQGTVVRQAAREVLQAVETRFAREIAVEGAEALEKRLALSLERYGEEVALAVRRVGPRIGLEAAEKYGAGGARLLADFGDEGARLLAIEGEAAVRVSRKCGADGIAQLTRHRGIAAPLIESFGDDGVRALAKVTPEGAAALSGVEKAIAGSGRSKEVLAVVERFGDRACQFIWRNKGAIFGTAVLAAFLRDPEPYIDGARKLVAEPAAAIAKGTNWTVVILASLAAVAGWLAWRIRGRGRCSGT